MNTFLNTKERIQKARDGDEDILSDSADPGS